MSKIILDDMQQKALDLLKGSGNVFITGNAGTGKSFIVKQFFDSLSYTEQGRIAKTASTGKAAYNIGGVTLHRLFKIPVKMLAPHEKQVKKEVIKIIKATKILFIDEISMVRFDVFQFVYNTLVYAKQVIEQEEGKPFNIRVIAVGDFLQLEPVVTPKDMEQIKEIWGNKYTSPFPFDTDAWRKLKFNQINLIHPHRQKDEQEYFQCLNRIRENENVQKSLDYINSKAKITSIIDKDAICLCPRNKEADSINSDFLREIDSPEEKLYSEEVCEIDKTLNIDPVLTLKVGARVIATANDKKGQFQNGSMGTILSFETKEFPVKTLNPEKNEIEEDPDETKEWLCVHVQFDGEEGICLVEPYTWENCEYKVVEEETESDSDTENKKDSTEVLKTKKKRKVLAKKIIGFTTQIPLKLGWAITIHKSQGASFDKAYILTRVFANSQLYVALSRVTKISGLSLDNGIPASRVKVAERAKEFYDSLLYGKPLYKDEKQKKQPTLLDLDFS